jgi:vitamin B12 transport system substrate-binding protein
VVSLAPSLSEIVVELGAADLLVGVLDGGERPAALAQVALANWTWSVCSASTPT